jgi:hypothetical protein
MANGALATRGVLAGRRADLRCTRRRRVIVTEGVQSLACVGVRGRERLCDRGRSFPSYVAPKEGFEARRCVAVALCRPCGYLSVRFLMRYFEARTLIPFAIWSLARAGREHLLRPHASPAHVSRVRRRPANSQLRAQPSRTCQRRAFRSRHLQMFMPASCRLGQDCASPDLDPPISARGASRVAGCSCTASRRWVCSSLQSARSRSSFGFRVEIEARSPARVCGTVP